MLLSYLKLVDLVERGVIENVPYENINGCSIDLTLGRYIQTENSMVHGVSTRVNLKNKEVLNTTRIDLDKSEFLLAPNAFILAQTEQVFHLPNHIAAEFKLKSSLARCGLNHALAGWCDPGWNSSVLTLELKNITRKHTLILEKGMKIGQIIFYEVEPVPDDVSYGAVGQYNGDKQATNSKGLR